jgi:hypothetical protein
MTDEVRNGAVGYLLAVALASAAFAAGWLFGRDSCEPGERVVPKPLSSGSAGAWRSKIWTEPHVGGEIGPDSEVWLRCRACVIRAESDSEIFACAQIKRSECARFYAPNPDVTNEQAYDRFGADSCACGKARFP